MPDTDAVATLRFAIHDAIAETAVQTGLRAGPVVDGLVDAILKSITDPSTAWAMGAVAEELASQP